MEVMIILRCFLIGVLASASLGPIFILTFNRGSVYGFWYGFATALGACVADGFYFLLGLIGVLAILQESTQFMFLLDTLGGCLLFYLGIYSLRKALKGENHISYEQKLGAWITIIKSFLLTALNPLALFFFMLISAQILPKSAFSLPLRQVFIASFFVSLGSLTVLTSVSFFSSLIGSSLSKKSLSRISFVSGLIFICVGLYLLDHLIINLIKIYSK
jgi:threonine/homoserine/homoserine lactone efflux protein